VTIRSPAPVLHPAAARTAVLDAAATLAGEGLVNAFGHVSARQAGSFLITPPVPLGTLTADAALLSVPLDSTVLSSGVPPEAWLHAAVYRARPDVGAIARAQPAAAAAVAASGRSLRALHGQGVLAGREVPVHPDARLARTQQAGDAIALSLGAATSMLLRGNGAVTTGNDPGVAAARMWALEASAALNLPLLAFGDVPGLSVAEVEHWEAVSDELLERLWRYLRLRHPTSNLDPA